MTSSSSAFGEARYRHWDGVINRMVIVATCATQTGVYVYIPTLSMHVGRRFTFASWIEKSL